MLRLHAICVAVLVWTAASAGAQVPTDTTHRLRSDPSAVRGGQSVYQLTLEREGATTPLGTRAVTVSEFVYSNSLNWLVLDVRSDRWGGAVDSLVFSRGDLQPLHFAGAVDSAHLVVDFLGDTASGLVYGPPGRRSFTTVLPHGALVSAAMAEVVLRTLPLAARWQDSVPVAAAGFGGLTTKQAALAVLGEERVAAPAGTFDCWVVLLSTDTARK